MTIENEVIINDCMSLEELEDAHIELMEEYKKLSKKIHCFKNSRASCTPSHENVLREKD